MSRTNGFSKLARLLAIHGSSADREKLEATLREEYPQEKLIKMSEHDGSVGRKSAIYALGIIGDNSAVPALVYALNHDEPDTCACAENSLLTIWFRSGSENADASLMNGLRFNKEENYEEAIDQFTEAILVAPNFAEAYNQRAGAYFMMESWEEALNDYKRTIELNRYHFVAFTGIGHCRMKLGKPLKALAAYRKAFQLNPNLHNIAYSILQLQSAIAQHSLRDDEENEDEDGIKV